MTYFREKKSFMVSYEDDDPENRLSRLPKEIFMKIMYQTVASVQEEFRFLVRQQIRNLPFCPRTELGFCFPGFLRRYYSLQFTIISSSVEAGKMEESENDVSATQTTNQILGLPPLP